MQTHAPTSIENQNSKIENPPTQSSVPNPQPPSPDPFHPFTDSLRHATGNLDDMLSSPQLSKDETDALLASQTYRSHRQLRTRLLAEQLQLVAQDYAQSAMSRLFELSRSDRPNVARLACTQLLAYANLKPQSHSPAQSPAVTSAVVPPSPPPAPPANPSSPPLIIHNSEFTIPPPPPMENRKSKIQGGENPSNKKPYRFPTLLILILIFILIPLQVPIPALPSPSPLIQHPSQLSMLPPQTPAPQTLYPASTPILFFTQNCYIADTQSVTPSTSQKLTQNGTSAATLGDRERHSVTTHSDQPTPIHPSNLSRRSFLSLLGLGTAATYLTGCESGSKPLPQAAAPTPAYHPLVSAPPATTFNDEYAPPVPTRPLPPPVTKVAPPNTYGILPRAMWARGGPNLATIDPMNGVKLITFHHSGDPVPFYASDFGETAQHLENVREYHRSRNFQDIGYHFAIDRVGRVWQLRSLKYQGQHVRYNNEHNIGVVVLGNFDLQEMTQAQKDKARIFGSLLRKEYALPISKVFTHKEIVSTECPGRGMQPYMVAIRKQKLI